MVMYIEIRRYERERQFGNLLFYIMHIRYRMSKNSGPKRKCFFTIPCFLKNFNISTTKFKARCRRNCTLPCVYTIHFFQIMHILPSVLLFHVICFFQTTHQDQNTNVYNHTGNAPTIEVIQYGVHLRPTAPSINTTLKHVSVLYTDTSQKAVIILLDLNYEALRGVTHPC